MSAVVVAAPALRTKAFDTLIAGPLRFAGEDVEVACADLEQGALFSMTTASLRSMGVAVDDSLLGAFAYREIFDVPLPSGRRGNFWEFLLTRAHFEQVALGWGDDVLIGRTAGSSKLWLMSGAADESIEMGDPHSAEVLACFVRDVAATAFCLADDWPSAFRIVDDSLELRVADRQVALRSYGGGVARGWPPVASDVPLFSDKRRAIRFVHDRLPARGDVASKLRERYADFEDLRLAGGSCLRLRL